MSSPAAAAGTRERLLAAAADLFAERGFHGTKIRDLAERGGVNVAAGHYHFGSKKDLYLEVLRAQFAEIRAALRRGGAARPAEEVRRLSRSAVEALLQARIEVMLDLLLGPPPGLHGTLMHREMCDPSEALPIIVDEFIAPMVAEMAEIVGRLEPRLEREAVERCVFSIMGQAVFYRFSMPAMLRLLGLDAYPPGFGRRLARHISEFSLGGVARVGAGTRRSRRRRAR
jgi:AcrR family transcriptional regulator